MGTQQRLGLRTLRHPRYSSGRTTGIAADGQTLGERRRASSAGFSYAREQDDVMKHSLQGAGPWNLVRPLPFSQSAEYATVKSCAAFLCGRLRRRLTRRSTSFYAARRKRYFDCLFLECSKSRPLNLATLHQLHEPAALRYRNQNGRLILDPASARCVVQAMSIAIA